jgi:MoaA/NifB/PqqE/SkfB family radical SAM enzyme
MSLKVGEIKPITSYQVIDINNEVKGLDYNYSVTFRITEACDLKCSYCHWHSGKSYALEDIIKTIDKLFIFFNKNNIKSVLFYYHGGEPTRHRYILDILKYIKKKGDEYGIVAYNEMQTNLTLKEELLNDILPYCDSFNVSFHYLELFKVGKKLEVFNNNFKYLTENNITIHNFDIMLENVPEERLGEFYRYIEKYLEYGNIINSEMIYGFCHYKYNKETAKQHLDFYNKHNKTEQKYLIDGKEYNTNDLFKKGINCVGWKCEAGQKSITINGDGNVFNCGIHMTNYLRECIPEKIYTNLINDNSSITMLSVLYKIGTKCRWDYCGGDFYLGKKKI